MAYETELLPPDIHLLWDPKTQHLRCIQQGDAAFFIRYNVPIGRSASGLQYVTDRRVTALAWAVMGLTQNKAGAYLGVSARTVHNQLGEIYGELGVQTPEQLDAGHNHALHAFSRLTEMRVVELGSQATLTHSQPDKALRYTDYYLQGMSVKEIGNVHNVTKGSVREQMRYRSRKEGCETIEAYVLRLLATRAIGETNYRPELMEELPALKSLPVATNAPFHTSAYRLERESQRRKFPSPHRQSRANLLFEGQSKH